MDTHGSQACVILSARLEQLARHIAKSVAMEEAFDKTISEETVVKVLGAEIHDKELYQGNDFAGVVTGLAWTQVGGEILSLSQV